MAETKGSRNGLTDAEVCDLTRLSPAIVYDARHGRVAIPFVLGSDSLWHDAGEALRAYRAGTHDRVAVEAAVARSDAEADAPNRAAIRAAEQVEENRNAEQRRINREHWAKVEAHRAAEEKKHADALEAATGLRKA
jgi:hypothetical protein